MKIKLFLAVMLTGWVSLIVLSGNTMADQKPVASISLCSYQFSPVLEGDRVTHDFIIKNSGTALLEIIKIETDCGCTAVSAVDHIQPGKEGAISLELNTYGYGGYTVKKITKVYTNDPDHEIIPLELNGHVRKYAVLDPALIALRGNVGQPVTARMTIAPAAPDLDFSIERVEVKENINLRFELRKNNETTPAHYELIVENTRTEPGRYYDIFTLWTDTDRKIYVRVYGQISP